VVLNSVSLIDPNQPVAVRVLNGASPGPDIPFYVGGRQFSIVGTSIERDRRVYTESLVNFSLPSAQNVWHPLICLRRKTTHGPSGRTNSTRCLIKSLDSQADNPAEFRVMYRDVSTGGVFAAPTDVPAIESACETKIQSGSTITASGTGVRILYDFVNNGRNTVGRSGAEESVSMSANLEIIVYARRITTTATVVSAVIRWEEDW
jgi:hypothetical protein